MHDLPDGVVRGTVYETMGPTSRTEPTGPYLLRIVRSGSNRYLQGTPLLLCFSVSFPVQVEPLSRLRASQTRSAEQRAAYHLFPQHRTQHGFERILLSRVLGWLCGQAASPLCSNDLHTNFVRERWMQL